MYTFECECVELNLQTTTESFGRFVFKPLGLGDGITIGNLFRRVLFSNVPGLSIVGIRIAGVNHEFSTIPGVREDVLEVLLNLKEVIFKSKNPVNSFGRLKFQGPGIITAACIEVAPDIEIINPSQYIATMANSSILEMEVKLDWGQGYRLGENQSLDTSMEFLRADALFMPIRRVAYQIETSQSESMESYEQLTLDIWTNGSITPPEAIALASKTVVNWFQAFESLNIQSPKKESLLEESNIKHLPIEDLCLPTRAYKALKEAKIHQIGDLLKLSRNELRKIKNFGPKSLQEVSNALEEAYGVILE